MSDLAVIIERTRAFKRNLCMGPLGLDADIVFEGDFIGEESFLRIIRLLEAIDDPILSEDRTKALAEAQDLLALLRAKPERPSEDDLCTRFSTGEIEARTVMHLTGWETDELFDRCKGLGLTLNAVD